MTDPNHPPASLLERMGGWPTLLFIGVLAFAIRLTIVFEGGGLHSVGGYDDGVYYSAADAFVHGRMPYRSFLLLHPPGIVLALSPFAWLGSVTSDSFGLAVGRLAFVGIGALNAILVALVLRRYGKLAALVGGVAYAVFYPAAYAERSTLLEPLGTLGTLVALLILSRERMWTRRWIFVAGLALGATLGVKIWYVVPVLVIIAFQRRERLMLIAGTAVGGALLYLPFFVLAPHKMFRYVVTDQLTRSQMSSVTTWARIESILGIGHPKAVDSVPFINAGSLGFLLVVLTAGIVALALRERTAWVYVALFAADLAVLLKSPSYFAHYATLTATPLALLIGVAVAQVAAMSAQPWVRAGVVAVALVAIAAVNVPAAFFHSGQHVPGNTLQAGAAKVQGCITADDPTILAVTNVLSRDLARGCPLWPDVTGWTYDKDRVVVNGKQLSRPHNPTWQHDVMAYLQSGSATIVFRSGTGLSTASRARLDQGPVLAKAGPFILRGTTPAGG